jgi:hypothetical protein
MLMANDAYSIEAGSAMLRLSVCYRFVVFGVSLKWLRMRYPGLLARRKILIPIE